jgi:CHASE3 domain sensor protein
MARDDGGWTIETLRVHIQAILDERDKALSAALAASNKAIDRVEESVRERFGSVNEFRQTLSDQAGTFITRTEVTAAVDRNTERINELTDRINKSEGKGAGLNASWVIVSAVLVILIALGGLIVMLANR